VRSSTNPRGWFEERVRYDVDYQNFMQSMRTFSLVIEHIAPHDRVLEVLRAAWNEGRRAAGLVIKREEFERRRSVQEEMYWPFREGFFGMGDVLKGCARRRAQAMENRGERSGFVVKFH
jgi:hypothetical protein